MRTAAFTGFGGPEHVEIREAADPTPGRGEAVVRVEACGLNRHDLWILQEGDDPDDLPFVPGVDVAGTVDAVGDGVDSVSPGDRVVLCPSLTCGTCRYCREGPENLCEHYDLYHGGLAERALVRADRLVALPDAVDVVQAAALPVAYVTAWHMIRRAEIQPGDLVFVPGATGGVGVAAVQLLDVLGARSIGTSTSAEKLDRLASVGADHVVETADPDAMERAVADLGPVDAVLNHLGGEYTGVGLSVLRRGGTMVICGRTAGDNSTVDVRDLFWQHKRVVGSTMGTQADLERLVGLVADGRLDPVVSAEYALADADRAFADLESRDAFGKLVVRPT